MNRGSSSPQYRAVTTCYDQLITATKHSVLSVMSGCVAKGLISEDVEDRVTSGNMSKGEQARWIMQCVRDAIKVNPSRYDDFIEILKNDRSLADVLEILQQIYTTLSNGSSIMATSVNSAFSHLDNPTTSLSRDSSSPEMMTDSIRQTTSGNEENSADCSINDILPHVKDVKNLRAFGLLLHIDSGKLDHIERSCSDPLTSIITEWFKLGEMEESDRRQELARVLNEPAVFEPVIARKIQPLSSLGSSGDSAISMMTSSSSTEPIPIQYQMFYIENIGRRKEECSVANVLNVVTLYSEWSEIGRYLELPSHHLEDIKKNCHYTDQRSQMVELWRRVDHEGFSWVKLQSALKQLVLNRRQRMESSTFSDNFPLSPIITEEPIQDLSYWNRLYSDEEVKVKIKELQNEFQNLQIEIQDILEEKGITFKRLKRIVSSFPGGVQLNSFRSLKKVSGDVDIDDVFSRLNVDMAWSFLDFYLLEHIVRIYASNDLKKRMENYSHEVTDFRTRTTVYSLIKVWPDPNMPDQSEECKTMLVRHNLDPATCTLERLETIRTHFCKLTKGIPLSETALVLYRLRIGCVIAIWIVRTDLVQTFKEAFTHCVQEGTFFKENYIINLELEGDIFMTMERMLLEASKEGDVQKLDGVLKKWNHNRHNINETDEDGKTALILSSEQGYNGVVVSLLEEEGISINYQTENEKWSALFFACKNGHDSTVRLLVEYGADTKLKDKDGKTAPIKKKLFQTSVKTTLKRIKEIRKTPIRAIKKAVLFTKKDIFHMCEVGDYAGVRRLVEEEKVDVNVKDTEYKEWTPLMWACEKGHFEIIKFLIQHKADISATAMNGWTALHIACSNNFVRIVNFLLKHGADPNSHISKETNYTALMWISDEGYVEIARSLLKHGADIEVPVAKNGWTALIIASDKGDKDLVQLYLEYGANPNRQGKKGWTALMAAARRGKGEVVKILIKHGAQVDMTMTDAAKQTGETALHVASYMGNAEVVRVLHEGGADVNIESEAGLTALMIATNRRKNKVVEALLESKTIDVNIPQKDTQLPALFLSAMNGDVEIFEKLRQHGASDEVDSVHVSDVARQFKQKKITAQLEKHKVLQEELQEVKQQHPSTVGPAPPSVPENTATAPIQPAPDTPTDVKKEQTDTERSLPKTTDDIPVEGVKKAGSGILRHDPTDLQQSQSDEGEPDKTEELGEQDLSFTEEKADDTTAETSSLYDAEEIVQNVSPQPPGPESQTAKGAKQELSSSREKAQILRKMNAEERMLLYMKIFKEHEQSVSNFDSSDLNEESEKTVKSVQKASYLTSITELQQEQEHRLILS